jgi:hypothetical protein
MALVGFEEVVHGVEDAHQVVLHRTAEVTGKRRYLQRRLMALPRVGGIADRRRSGSARW